MTGIFGKQTHYPRTPTACLNTYTICTAYEITATIRLWYYYIIIIIIIIVVIIKFNSFENVVLYL